MRHAKNDVDTFIMKQYTENGLHNIYGCPKYNNEFIFKDENGKPFKLIDTTIKTYTIKEEYFFVVYGFKQSK